MKLKTLLENKKQNILDTAARYGAFNIRIFGSVARGDDDESGLLIELHGKIYIGLGWDIAFLHVL